MKICPIHGVYKESRCIKCQKSSYKVYNKIYRDKSVQKFYDSSLWKKVRAIQLRGEPLCVGCGQIATVVDHIKEIKDGGEQTSLENLQSMCISCHSKKTQIERGKRGS